MKSQAGVALIMVLTSIMILTALWGDFTFDSKISRIKTTNVMDRTQAKFLAESALELGITRLRLYKEAYNMWSKNPDAKNAVNIQLLNQIWELPFMYPLPLPPSAGAQVKASIDDFAKNAILEGEFKLSIQNISSKLNLNSLRVDILTKIPDINPANPGAAANQLSVDDPNHPDHPDNPANQKDPAFSVEQQLINHLTLKFNEKKEEDETFDDRYGSLDPIQLVANLKYYMSDKGANRLQNTPVEQRYPEAEQSFDEAKVSPKFGPLSSFSEMNLIPGWDEEIINLVKDEFGVFPSVQIDLNKLTDSMLRLLIPSMSPDDVKQFFEYRDDPNTPHVFNTLDDFKNYIVRIANLMDETSFDDRFNKFSKQGITFGPAPSLFKLIAEGTFNRATYTIIATISMPALNQTPVPNQPANNNNPNNPTPPTPPQNNQPAPAQSAQLQDPRVIEILVN
jgi:general secretion pathway protein K